jgi:hypothetical protein
MKDLRMHNHGKWTCVTNFFQVDRERSWFQINHDGGTRRGIIRCAYDLSLLSCFPFTYSWPVSTSMTFWYIMLLSIICTWDAKSLKVLCLQVRRNGLLYSSSFDNERELIRNRLRVETLSFSIKENLIHRTCITHPFTFSILSPVFICKWTNGGPLDVLSVLIHAFPSWLFPWWII